jgi:hypothetical protein
MHRVLYILEVLRIILSDCDKKTLGRLARTCRLFCDPALDTLWSLQPSLITLLEYVLSDLLQPSNLMMPSRVYYSVCSLDN